MFKQIVTYTDSASTIPNGVLNFKIEDISYFHVSTGSIYAYLLIKGSAVYYTVLYKDLQSIISNKEPT